MKKYIPKSTKRFYVIAALFAFICSIIVYSCKTDQKENPIPQTVSEAQKWYESTYPQILSNTKGLITQSIGDHVDLTQIIKPDWKHSANYTRLGQNVIEMPVDPKAKLALTLKTPNWVFNRAYSRSYYLLIGGNQKFNAYILTFIADSDYVKNDTSKLKNNTYRKIDANFTGLVVYSTPKGEYLGGYGYKNGKLVMPQTVTQQAGKQQIQSINSGKLKPDNMVEICTDYYQQVTVSYDDGSYWTGNWEYVGTTCVAGDDGSGGGGGGGGSSSGNNGGTSSGGGGGGAPSTPPPACPPSTSSPCAVPVEDALKTNNLPLPGDGGTPPPPTNSPCTVTTPNCATATVKTDSLARHFPCGVSLIINALVNNASMSKFVAPFTTTRRPDLIYTDSVMTWNSSSPLTGPNSYQLGATGYYGRNAFVKINTRAFQNSSQLLLAAAVIHETLHAYINYQIETNTVIAPAASYSNTKSWLVSLDYWALQNGVPGNYRDHNEMLTDYFDQAVTALKSWDNAAHSDAQYAEAMLYGLNTNDFLALPANSPSTLQTAYNAILTKYNLTQANVNDFNSQNVVVTNTALTGTNARLPTTGCTP